MSKATVFITDGTEEVECLTTVDLLRRAGVEVQLVAVSGQRTILSSHKVSITADLAFDEASYDDSDLLFIPGGMPGTLNMTAHEGLKGLLKRFADEDKYISAVCAGPTVLGNAGLLNGKRATCFPGFEDKLGGAIYTAEGITTDGKIITGRGLGFSIDLGLELIKVLEGEEKALDIKGRIQHTETI